MTPTVMKTGDTDITFSDTIQKDGQPFDLTGCPVDFVMRNMLGGSGYSGSGTVGDQSGSGKGSVTFTVDNRFPTGIGAYLQEWEVTTADETPLTFTYPEDGYNIVRIMDKLA